jgi:hypothetical protein
MVIRACPKLLLLPSSGLAAMFIASVGGTVCALAEGIAAGMFYLAACLTFPVSRGKSDRLLEQARRLLTGFLSVAI